MPGTSFRLRIDDENDAHVHVSVFAGPDEDHRACVGRLVFRRPEWEDFQRLVELSPTLRQVSRDFAGAHVNADEVLGVVRRRLLGEVRRRVEAT